MAPGKAKNDNLLKEWKKKKLSPEMQKTTWAWRVVSITINDIHIEKKKKKNKQKRWEKTTHPSEEAYNNGWIYVNMIILWCL